VDRKDAQDDLKKVQYELAAQSATIAEGGNRRRDGRLSRYFEVKDAPANQNRVILGVTDAAKQEQINEGVDTITLDDEYDYGLVEESNQD
jgi:hypothetical protein